MRRLFSWFKRRGRAIVRALAYDRIDRLPLTERRADHWREQFKRWPAIFDEDPYKRLVTIAADTKMEVGLSDFIERTLAIRGEWDGKVLNVLKQRLGPGDVFVDVGANVGYFSLIASRLVGDQGIVFTFEPSPRALEKLISNLRRNNIENVVLFSTACGYKVELHRLNQASWHNIGASSFCGHIGSEATENVPVLPLDNLLGGLDIAPSLIKIDVEGYEFEALRGMVEILVRHRPEVLMEITPRWLRDQGHEPIDVHAFMSPLGYEALLVGEGGLLKPLRPDDFQVLEGQEEVLFKAMARGKIVL